MKEFKLRVWFEKEKKMLQVQRFQLKTGMIMPYDWNMQHKDCFSHPMQFTGVKDKKGVDVYEEDYVLFKGNFSCDDWIGVVRTKDFAFQCIDLAEEEDMFLCDLICDGVLDGVVIGNSFEVQDEHR